MPSIVTAVLSLVTFANLLDAKSNHAAIGISNGQLDAALAATMLSAIMLLLLIFVASIVFARRSGWNDISEKGQFSYPFITASYLHIAIFALLSGMILVSNEHWLDEFEEYISDWSSADSHVYQATYVLYFIDTGILILMFISLLFLNKRLKSKRSTQPSIREYTTGDEEHEVTGMAPPPSHHSSWASKAFGLGKSNQEQRNVELGRVTPPSDYRNSVDAAQQSMTGAWKN